MPFCSATRLRPRVKVTAKVAPLLSVPATRAWSLPCWMASFSLPCRMIRPVASKWMASNAVVLPCPFCPVNNVTPSARRSSAQSTLRN